LNPKKSRDLINEVSKNQNLPQHIVDAVVKFYWKEVWENLTNLSASKVHVENLGDFNIKHWLLDKEILKCENTDKSIYKRNYIAGISIRDRIDLLKKIKSEVEEENQRKDFIYEHKKINKDSETDLGEQTGDLSRNIL